MRTFAEFLRTLPDSILFKKDGSCNYDGVWQEVVKQVLPKPSTLQRAIAKEGAKRRAEMASRKRTR